MPFIENLDMDRLAVAEPRGFERVARQNASRQYEELPVDLAAMDSQESAAVAVAAWLWNGTDRTAAHMRLLKACLRFVAGDVEKAHDLVMDQATKALGQWKRITNLQGWMWRACRNAGIDAKRHSRHETTVAKFTEVADAVECGDIWGNRAVDEDSRGALQSLAELWKLATATEKRIIKLAGALGWDNTPLYPTFEAIGTQLRMSGAEVSAAMKALGVRAGVWTSERRLVRVRWQAGPRRSQWWLRAQVASYLWAVARLFGTLDGLEWRETWQDSTGEFRFNGGHAWQVTSAPPAMVHSGSCAPRDSGAFSDIPTEAYCAPLAHRNGEVLVRTQLTYGSWRARIETNKTAPLGRLADESYETWLSRIAVGKSAWR